jgi:hypothetical protein
MVYNNQRKSLIHLRQTNPVSSIRAHPRLPNARIPSYGREPNQRTRNQ